jgi:hypothetical protein
MLRPPDEDERQFRVWQFSFARYQLLTVNSLEHIGELPTTPVSVRASILGEGMNSLTKNPPDGDHRAVVSGVRWGSEQRPRDSVFSCGRAR